MTTPTAAEGVVIESRDGVLHITLDRPSRKNSLHLPSVRRIVAALEAAATDDGLRVVVLAGNGDDLLIGGWTSFDENVTAVDLVRAAWSHPSAGSYETRVTHLREGTGLILAGTGVKLAAAGSDRTVFDDGQMDILKGDQGRDWFFADLGSPPTNDDRLTDRIWNELVDLIDLIDDGPHP